MVMYVLGIKPKDKENSPYERAVSPYAGDSFCCPIGPIVSFCHSQILTKAF